jgi:hypothetical protein
MNLRMHAVVHLQPSFPVHCRCRQVPVVVHHEVVSLEEQERIPARILVVACSDARSTRELAQRQERERERGSKAHVPGRTM